MVYTLNYIYKVPLVTFGDRTIGSGGLVCGTSLGSHYSVYLME
jgi:hypothetical protein